MLPTITNTIRSISMLILILAGNVFSEPERKTTVWVAPDSEVVISGTTNVNQFTCKYNLEELEVPIRLVYDEKVEQILFKNARLRLANDCFDCGGRGINKDFRELLKTERYPQVELKLLHVDPPGPNDQKIGVGMEIKIAGVTREYEAQLNCEQKAGICVEGSLPLRLSDFGLDPPRKVLGMVKVDNEIKVKLALRFKEI